MFDKRPHYLGFSLFLLSNNKIIKKCFVLMKEPHDSAGNVHAKEQYMYL